MATKQTNKKTFTLLGKDNRKVVIECYTKRGGQGFTHFAECEGKKTYICYINRTWESFEYESVLLRIVKRIALDKKDLTAMEKTIELISKGHKEEVDKWFENFKKDYDGLSDTTKKHLANACPVITSKEQADEIMKVSKVFDAMFRLEEGNQKNEGGQQ